MADLTTTNTSSIPDWAQPYASGFLQRAQDVTNTPYQQYQGQQVAGLNQYQTQAADLTAQRAMQGSPTMSAANGALTGYFGGQSQGATANPYGQVQTQANPYAGSNPYLQQNIDSAQGDLVRQWNNVAKPQWDTSMQQSGSFGNAGVAQAQAMGQEGLQRQLGNVSSTMRMQDYTAQQQLGESAANRALQASTSNASLGEQYAGRNDSMYNNGQSRGLQALGMAPTFANQDYTDLSALGQAGQTYQTNNQAQLTSGYNNYLDARNYPTQQLGAFGTALGQAVGNQGTTTNTSPGVSTGSSVVGGALTGASLYNMLFGG
jgi:hypothetical protein